MSGKKTPDYMMSASRLPALLGLSKYQTPNDELQFSINASKGVPREDKQNEAMAWGDRLESIILRETAKRLELFELSTEFDSAFYHDTLPLACSLDGYAHGRGQKIRTDTECQPACLHIIDVEYNLLELDFLAKIVCPSVGLGREADVVTRAASR